MSNASAKWQSIEDVSCPNTCDTLGPGSLDALSSSERITVENLYQLGIHPENNLMIGNDVGVGVADHEIAESQFEATGLEDEQTFVKIEERLRRERLDYCRQKKAPQVCYKENPRHSNEMFVGRVFNVF